MNLQAGAPSLVVSSNVVVQGDITDVMLDDITLVGRAAWDVETSGLDWRRDCIGTVQLFSPGRDPVIVQVGQQTPINLLRLLEDENVTKVFHHAPFDLRFMAHYWGAQPSNIECTKIASKIIFRDVAPQEHSLERLLRRLLGVTISKTVRCSNWTQEQLSPDQLSYAIADVRWLLDLMEILTAAARAAGKLDLLAACFRHIPTSVELDLDGYGDVFAY